MTWEEVQAEKRERDAEAFLTQKKELEKSFLQELARMTYKIRWVQGAIKRGALDEIRRVFPKITRLKTIDDAHLIVDALERRHDEYQNYGPY